MAKPSDRAIVNWIINNVVDRMYASAPDAKVEQELRQRLEGRSTPAAVDRAVARGLRRHRHNQAIYRYVMGGGVK